jgi:predicted phosphodiesterase
VKYLILSDIHGNWDAFQAVLRKVRRKRFDATLLLGDLVGYGAAPNQVMDALCRLPGQVHVVRGNHDKVVARIESAENFNPTARKAAEWTTGRLTRANLGRVHDLPQGPLEIPGEGGHLAICHGSPQDEDRYVFADRDAASAFAAYDVPLVFFGHTHITSVFWREPGQSMIGVQALKGTTGTVEIEDGTRYMINPGSIGQPRDGDPRASYMVYDSDRRLVRWHRVDYPIQKAQGRIRKAGLPRGLATRLGAGT